MGSSSESPRSNGSKGSSDDLSRLLFEEGMLQINIDEARKESLHKDRIQECDSREQAFLRYADIKPGCQRFAPGFMNNEQGLFYTAHNGGVITFLYSHLPGLPIQTWYMRKIMPEDEDEWTVINDPAMLENLN